MADYGTVASEVKINKTVTALRDNNFQVEVVEDLEAAKAAVLDKIKPGAEVFTATSITLQESGLDEILNSEPYESVRNKFMEFYGQDDKALHMKQIGSAADVSVGSVHAITEDGQLMIASKSGSQLPNAAYGAAKVIFVVGAQKLVTDMNEGVKRIKEHSVPREDKRALAAYGVNTKFNKLLMINSDDAPERVNIIIVKQNVGY